MKKNKMQFDLSIKEKKLLLILLACVLLFVAYQFGYVMLTNKADSNNVKITELQDRVAILELMNRDKTRYIEGIETCGKEMEAIRAKFIKKETPEDNIMFIRTIEKSLHIEVYEINLYDKVLLTSAGSEQIQSDVNAGNTDATGEPVEDAGTQFVQTGYNYTVDMKFRCSYEKLKKMICYINEYPYMRAIQSVSVVFDADTGELIGELTMNIYTLEEATNEYEEPSTGVTNLGNQNIFGTLN